VTLSIGDGANDVSMIQEANVGIGIEGMEGAQAVRASDYSFVEFRALRHLLAIHGRYSMLRMSNLILYSLYKSIALITVQCWFGFVSAWSGQSVYFDVFLTLWNVLYTDIPPILSATFDKDVDEDKIEKYPQLYKAVKEGKFWNVKTELSWFIASILHSIVVFGAFVLTLGSEGLFENGESIDINVQMFIAGSLILLTVTGKFCLMHRHWIWPITAAIIGSKLVYLLTMYVLEKMTLIPPGTFLYTHQTPSYYFLLLLVPVTCCMPDFVMKYLRRNYYPDDAMIIKELNSATTTRVESEDGSY